MYINRGWKIKKCRAKNLATGETSFSSHDLIHVYNYGNVQTLDQKQRFVDEMQWEI